MIVSLAVLCSRAKRRKEPLLFLRFHSVLLLPALLDSLATEPVYALVEVTDAVSETERLLLHEALQLFATSPSTIALLEQGVASDGGHVLHLQSIVSSTELEALLRSTHPEAVTVPLARTTSALAVQHIVQQARVPVLAQESVIAPATLKRFLRAGLSGVVVEQELENAFTAGLRTGIRDRVKTDPVVYSRPANKAVSSLIHRYLHYIR